MGRISARGLGGGVCLALSLTRDPRLFCSVYCFSVQRSDDLRKRAEELDLQIQAKDELITKVSQSQKCLKRLAENTEKRAIPKLKKYLGDSHKTPQAN